MLSTLARCGSTLWFALICAAQSDPVAAVVRAFETHDIVMFGEYHACKQEYEWLRTLVGDPRFADRVDDIVVEFGNSLFQKSVDQYIAGEDVPFDQVRHAWRDVAGAVDRRRPSTKRFIGRCARRT